jgi:AcrR family transcriptional regulator
MGHKHTKAQILAGALETAFAGGVSTVSYERVARHLEISDRVVVYYFPTKAHLIGEVLGALGVRLQEALAAAVEPPVADHRALLRAAWPVLARPDADRVFAMFFEASGLAAAGRAPYADVVPTLVDAWIEWAAGVLEGSPQRRRHEAEAAIALVDGLLLLRQLAGPEAADRAASQLGDEPTLSSGQP